MSLFFFFNDTATTEIYTLSLHDALPISYRSGRRPDYRLGYRWPYGSACGPYRLRSEEHTSELQSQSNIVCRLLLEKKKHVKRSPSLLPAFPVPAIHCHRSDSTSYMPTTF